MFIKQYLKLCFVGVSGVVVQFCAYNLLRYICSPSLALIIAIILAIANNYYFHGKVTFKGHGYTFWDIFSRKGLVFVVYQLIMILLQVEWLKITTAFIGKSALHENMMIFLGMLWGSVMNFFIYKNFVWKYKQPYH